MRKKRRYQATAVKRVVVEELVDCVREQRVVLGVDVAKEAMVAAVMDEGQAVWATVKWTHPAETLELVELAEELRQHAAEVVVAMEPTGVYGDALRWQLQQRGFEVHSVSAKKTHDMAEVYDNVPSKHDAKDAAIIAKLCMDGMSEPWAFKSERDRELLAALRMVEVHEGQLRALTGRLEAQLSRHWPEVTGLLLLRSTTLLEVLSAYGGPAGVAADIEGAKALMRRVGRNGLSTDKRLAVLVSAQRTLGVPQLPCEVQLLVELATEARRNQLAHRAARRRVEQLAVEEGATRHLQAVVGKTTSAVLVAYAGDPGHYDSPQAYVKALGLNLRERSSGRHKGRLRITKRGSSIARRWLYLAALRLLKSNAIVRSWYAKKVARDGGKAKPKAVIAVVRKLALALWHVARGAEFDAAKLYDVRRLQVPA